MSKTKNLNPEHIAGTGHVGGRKRRTPDEAERVTSGKNCLPLQQKREKKKKATEGTFLPEEWFLTATVVSLGVNMKGKRR